MIRAIHADNFSPFAEFNLEFPPLDPRPDSRAEIHLFTGINGTGKTRVLSVLAAVLGNVVPLQHRLKGQSPPLFFVTNHSPLPPRNATGQWARLSANSAGSTWVQHLPGFTDSPGQKPALAYKGNAYVSDSAVQVMGTTPVPNRETCLTFDRPPNSSPLLLQGITNLIVSAGMDKVASSDKDASGSAAKIIEALEKAVTEITGNHFGFVISRLPVLSIGVAWGSSRLPFDLLPDGLRSIIGWMVHAAVTIDLLQQGKGDPLQAEATFLLDEIETHLHPSWQRKILPAFQRLFPKSQIFVATHSPFVIASVNHGWIHPLTLDSRGKVHVQKPVPAGKGDSYVTVLEQIMGVKELFDPDTEKLLSAFRDARTKAYEGDNAAHASARQLAHDIAQRSVELEYMMGRELLQMDRQLNSSEPKR